MIRLRALIVDDEPGSREVLIKLLKWKFPAVELVGEAADVDSAFKMANDLKPDLVFLDIQLSGASGFRLLEKYERVPFDVVFITSYDEQAINAIRLNALNYLLKPVEVFDLQNAMEKAFGNKEANSLPQQQVINLLHHLRKDADEYKLAVHHGEKVKLLNEKEILYVEADNRYCKIYLDTNKVYTAARHLKEFEDYFGENSSFIRINKSVILNTRHILEYSKGEPFIIGLSNGSVFEVSRRKKPMILEKLKRAGMRKLF